MKKPAITIYPIIKKEKRYRHQSQSLLINDPVHIQVPDHLQQMKIEHIRARKRFKRLVEERVAKSTRLVISIFLLHNLKSCSQQTDCLVSRLGSSFHSLPAILFFTSSRNHSRSAASRLSLSASPERRARKS
jgi:hypothetical protein